MTLRNTQHGWVRPTASVYDQDCQEVTLKNYL
jgi:hypothetical protein